MDEYHKKWFRSEVKATLGVIAATMAILGVEAFIEAPQPVMYLTAALGGLGALGTASGALATYRRSQVRN